MVGSELPTPETRERRSATSSSWKCTGSPSSSDGAAAARPGVASQSIVARSSASPASRATARPSSSRRSSGSGLAAGRITLGGLDISHASTRFRREPASATSPKTATMTGCCCRAAVGERMLGHQSQAPYAPRDRGSTAGRGARDRARSSTSSTSARPASTCRVRALGRQPAEAHRRARDARPTRSVLIAAHPTRGVDVGAQAAVWDEHPRGPDAGPGGAAHFGRPRGADRAVRHPARDPPRPHRRPPSTPPPSPGRARLLHDRRAEEATPRDLGTTPHRLALRRAGRRGRARRSSSSRRSCSS